MKRKAQSLGLGEDMDIEITTEAAKRDGVEGADDFPCFIPYNLVTQHSIPGTLLNPKYVRNVNFCCYCQINPLPIALRL